MKISYLLFAILFISSTCKKNKNCNKLITIKNESSTKVMIQRFINYDGDYRDTVIICPYYGNFQKLINPNDNDSDTYTQRHCWQKTLKNGTTFDLFVVDIKNYDLNTPCDTIKKNCKVLFRKQYTLEDLEKINFKIEYK